MITSTVPTSLFLSSQEGTPVDSPQEASTKFTEFALEALRIMCQESQIRMKTSQFNKHVLSKGIYYPNEFYQCLNKVGDMECINHFRSRGYFVYGYAPRDCFEFATNLIGTASDDVFCGFKLKDDKLPVDGLEAVYDGLTLTDSVGACKLAYHIALAQLLGENKYNVLFGNESATPLIIGSYLDPINLFIKPASQTTLKPGQVVHYSNVNRYSFKHHFGDRDAISVMYSNVQKGFIGLGLDLPNPQNPQEGASVEQINEILIQSYNNPPINKEILTGYWSDESNNADNNLDSDQINPEQFNLYGGGRVKYTLEINEERIYRLAIARINEVACIMKIWLWLDER